MKKMKALLLILLLPLILVFSLTNVTKAATITKSKTNTKLVNLVVAFDNKKGNYQLIDKSITVAIDGKTIYSGKISASTKSDKLKTAAIKDISIKKLNVDVTKNRSVPIKITIGTKSYYTYINTDNLKHTHLSTLKIKAQYTNGKNPSLNGFLNYKWL